MIPYHYDDDCDILVVTDVQKWHILDSEDPLKEIWSLSAYSYTKKAVEEVERELTAANLRLPTKVTTPLSSGYRPELDSKPELDPKRQNYYQGLIGILRWICELGRVDIVTPVSMLSRYLVM